MWKFVFYLFIGAFVYFYIVSLRYRNPYKLIMLFGKKGSGKNTLLTKLSIKYNKMGYHVYSDSEIYNTFKLDTSWIGKYDFPENSVLMIEEAGIVWDNRNFKTFSAEVRNFFKLQRHKKVIVYLASQSFDVDKKLRDLTDEMYLLVNYMGIFSVAKKINKHISIHNGTDENNGESFLTETYAFDFPWKWKFTYIPRWIRFFNSFEAERFPRVKSSRYRFLDEAELYRLTNWLYYKKSQILNLFYYVGDLIENRKNQFSITFEDLFQIGEWTCEGNELRF